VIANPAVGPVARKLERAGCEATRPTTQMPTFAPPLTHTHVVAFFHALQKKGWRAGSDCPRRSKPVWISNEQIGLVFFAVQ
jgi:hypothetical protein